MQSYYNFDNAFIKKTKVSTHFFIFGFFYRIYFYQEIGCLIFLEKPSRFLWTN